MSHDDAAPGSSRAAAPTLGLRRRAVRPLLTDEQRGEIEEAFSLFDVEKVGSVDAHELKVALRALGFEVKKADVRALIAEFAGGDDRVGHDAFVAILTKKYLGRDPEDDFRKAFALFDEDGSGKVTAKNLRRVARELGESIAEDELDAMIGACGCAPCRAFRCVFTHSPSPPPPPPLVRAEEFDSANEGSITLDNFLEIMRTASA
jgi:centrin-3